MLEEEGGRIGREGFGLLARRERVIGGLGGIETAEEEEEEDRGRLVERVLAGS